MGLNPSLGLSSSMWAPILCSTTMTINSYWLHKVKKKEWIQLCKPDQRWVGLWLSKWNLFVSTIVALRFLQLLADSLLKTHLANLIHTLILCFFTPLLIEPSLFVQNLRLTASSALKKHMGKIHRHQPCIPYSMRVDSNNYVTGRRHPNQATDS